MMPLSRILGWVLWATIAVVWTVGLTSRYGGPEGFGDTPEMREYSRFVMAKTTHVGIYTAWTILTGWLRPPFGIRLFLLMFLMSHAVLTEWAQTYVEGRMGLLRDAALDHLGIFLGVVIAYRWWAAERMTNDQPPKSQGITKLQ